MLQLLHESCVQKHGKQEVKANIHVQYGRYLNLELLDWILNSGQVLVIAKSSRAWDPSLKNHLMIIQTQSDERTLS